MTYIYLIQCGDSTYYKVGIADEPEQRVAKLQIGCPYALSIVLTCRLSSRTAATTAEAQIHRALANYRLHSEWFNLPADVVKTLMTDMITNTEPD